eukprot:comp21558_c0_seq1/m.30085 comp21558_c0_seq1/g.30085  ORF comp21558_c0_seq1/g.30085 comp21558_c0_seq1/m.30085 type:complete len:686 (-) comp21558_c0_seq1:189-2246(-)
MGKITNSIEPRGSMEGLVNPGRLEQRFQVGQIIGQGAYSTVRLGQEKDTSKLVAIKYVDKKHAFKDMNLEKECRLLRTLGRHPNINAFIDLYENDKYYMIVLEYMKGGELLDILIKRVERSAQPYSEAQVAVMLRQIVSAVDHCHRNNIIHRDLKPENVLVSDEESLGTLGSMTETPLKLADFGLATYVPSGTYLEEPCGTPSYMAPERLCRKPYDTKSDIWSIGVIMYTLIAGAFPFYGETDEEIRWSTMNPNEPEFGAEFAGISRPCIELLRDHLLAKSPTRRPTAAELLSHPWMTGELASTSEIKGALSQLKRFNARRKFRSGVKALMASNRLRGILQAMWGEQMIMELAEYSINVQDVFELNRAFIQATQGTHLASQDVFVELVLHHLQIPKEELILRLFEAFQVNGKVNTREFCLSLATKVGASETQTLELAFQLFDSDGSGSIDQREYSQMITAMLSFLGDSSRPNNLWLQQEFEAADTDNSGLISKEEFITAARNNIKIQQYLASVAKMLKSKDNVRSAKLAEQKEKKQGYLFVRKEKGFVANLLGSGNFKEKWVVLEGDAMNWYGSEQECKHRQPPTNSFRLAELTLVAGGSEGPRSRPRIRLDMKGGERWCLEAKTFEEMKVWESLLSGLSMRKTSSLEPNSGSGDLSPGKTDVTRKPSLSQRLGNSIKRKSGSSH